MTEDDSENAWIPFVDTSKAPTIFLQPRTQEPTPEVSGETRVDALWKATLDLHGNWNPIHLDPLDVLDSQQSSMKHI